MKCLLRVLLAFCFFQYFYYLGNYICFIVNDFDLGLLNKTHWNCMMNIL